MMQFKTVNREPLDQKFVHEHLPEAETLMSRRVLDADKDKKLHVLAWRFNNKRKQWEAQCEWADIIYTAPVTDKDVEFRKGRSIE